MVLLLTLKITMTMKSDWTYKGRLFTQDQVPPEAIGFVYKITRISDGKFYFGKKLFWFTKTSVKTVTLKNGNKRKKKTKTPVPSDWMIYWSSSEALRKDVAELGEEAFTREILCMCPSKGTLSYMELKYQMEHKVLEIPGDRCYNGIVNVRISKIHLKPMVDYP